MVNFPRKRDRAKERERDLLLFMVYTHIRYRLLNADCDLCESTDLYAVYTIEILTPSQPQINYHKDMAAFPCSTDFQVKHTLNAVWLLARES